MTLLNGLVQLFLVFGQISWKPEGHSTDITCVLTFAHVLLEVTVQLVNPMAVLTAVGTVQHKPPVMVKVNFIQIKMKAMQK